MLAVPVFEDHQIVATIGLTWITSALELSEAIGRYLEPLRDVADGIGANLARDLERGQPLRAE